MFNSIVALYYWGCIRALRYSVYWIFCFEGATPSNGTDHWYCDYVLCTYRARLCGHFG